ncbi:MAG: DUF3048 domain-containing protein [Acidimicrobiales bacterium]
MRRPLLTLFIVFSLLAVSCGGGDEAADDSSGDTISTSDADDRTTAEAAGDSDGGATTTTEVPLAPPTSRGPAPILDVDPVASIGAVTIIEGEPAYRGLLGQLDPQRNIVQAAALPPADVAPGIAPLTGLPVSDPSIGGRPAIVAKIDNTDKGRPQAALTQADVVYVTQIEGGSTRLVAVFHSRTPAEIGPVRSGRTTDIAIFRHYNNPIFVWSGANVVTGRLIRPFLMVDLGAATRDEYRRHPDRPASYDLMTDPSELWAIAEAIGAGGVPPVQFEYRTETTAHPPSARAAGELRIDYAAATVEYFWDESLRVYRRVQNGIPHVDADDLEVRPVNVVVAEVGSISTGLIDTAGSSVGEQQFIGSGRGWVFTDGQVIEVTWTKPSLASVPTWTTADGIPVPLTPGQTWVELAPAGVTSFG